MARRIIRGWMFLLEPEISRALLLPQPNGLAYPSYLVVRQITPARKTNDTFDQAFGFLNAVPRKVLKAAMLMQASAPPAPRSDSVFGQAPRQGVGAVDQRLDQDR